MGFCCSKTKRVKFEEDKEITINDKINNKSNVNENKNDENVIKKDKTGSKSKTNENLKNNEHEIISNNLNGIPNDKIDNTINDTNLGLMNNNENIMNYQRKQEQKIIKLSELNSDPKLAQDEDKNDELIETLNNEENESVHTKSTKLSLFQRNKSQNSYTSFVEHDETFEKISETSFSKSLPTCFNQDADTRYSLEGADDGDKHQLPNNTKFLELPEKHFSKAPSKVLKKTDNSKNVIKNEQNKNFKKHLKLLEKRFTLSAKNTYIRDRIENEVSTIDDKTRYGSSIKDSKVNNSFSVELTQKNESSGDDDSENDNDSEDMAVLAHYILDQENETVKSTTNETNDLMEASKNGDVKKIEYLVNQKGIDCNVENENGTTAISLAALNGHMEIVEYLISKNENLNIDKTDKYGMSPLMYATAKGYQYIVEILVRNKANIDEKNMNGMNSLMIAVQNGNLYIVKILLTSDLNVDDSDIDGLTAVMLASFNGFSDILECLLKKNSNSNLKDKNGKNALMLASEKGYYKIVEILVKFGIQINDLDNENMSALMYASKNAKNDRDIVGNGCQHTKIVEFLIENGANVHFKNKFGWNALMFATRQKSFKLVELIVLSNKTLPFFTHED